MARAVTAVMIIPKRRSTPSMAAILGCALAVVLSAGEKSLEPPVDVAKTVRAKKAAVKTSDEALANWETYQSFMIDPGKSAVLDSNIDYRMLGKVLVSVRAATDSLGDLANLTMVAYWSAPELEQYNASDQKSGTQLIYTSTGAVMFEVFGPQFRLVLRNTGETSIKLQQVLLFARLL